MGLPYVYCETCGERTQQTVLYVRTISSGSKRSRKWEQIFRYCRQCSALSHVIKEEYSLKSGLFSATRLLSKEEKGLSIAVPKHLAENVVGIFRNDSLSVDEVSLRLRKAGTRASDYAVAATLEALVGAGMLRKESVDCAERAMENMRKNTSWYKRCPKCRAEGISKLYARFGERRLASVGSVCVICGHSAVKRRNLLFWQGRGILRGNPSVTATSS